MKDNDWKDRLGVVFSTNPDYQYEYQEDQEQQTFPCNQQKLRVRMEKNNRGGKIVTVISGFTGTSDDIKELGRKLKTAIGVGGSVKDGDIIIQGDMRERIVTLLKSWGYSQTK